MGSHPAYFNIEGITENSLTLGDYDDSKKIRDKIFELFEEAGKQGKSPPKIVIGGAGFTGIELAGEISDCLPEIYSKHGFTKPEKAFTIVEALPTILPGWDEKRLERTALHLLQCIANHFDQAAIDIAKVPPRVQQKNAVASTLY